MQQNLAALKYFRESFVKFLLKSYAGAHRGYLIIVIFKNAYLRLT